MFVQVVNTKDIAGYESVLGDQFKIVSRGVYKYCLTKLKTVVKQEK